jgi:hypothetical protein
MIGKDYHKDDSCPSAPSFDVDTIPNDATCRSSLSTISMEINEEWETGKALVTTQDDRENGIPREY